jgi:hypothetical protein
LEQAITTMLHLKFEPNIGAAPLNFGASRNAVRTSLAPLTPRMHATEPENDFYTANGLILGFDRQDNLEFIEVFPPSSAEFGEIRFFEESLPRILMSLAGMGFLYKEIHGAYRFNTVGISLYCPNQTIESASLFRAGYYDGV